MGEVALAAIPLLEARLPLFSAISPTGWGQAIAGTYFIANGITTLVTGKGIGQHIEGVVNKYYNDGVRAEEQRKFNAAMGY